MSPTSRRRKAALIKPDAWFMWQKNCLPRNFKSQVMTLLLTKPWTSCSHREILKTVCSIRTGAFCIRQKNYRNRLKINGIIQSMSPRVNCWDNVCTEHFFGALKVEAVMMTCWNPVGCFLSRIQKNLLMILSNLILLPLNSSFEKTQKFGLNKKILQLKLHGSGDFAQCFQRRNRSLCFYIKKMTSRYAGFHRKPYYRNIFFNAESSYSVDHILYVFGHFDKLKILLIALYLE